MRSTTIARNYAEALFELGEPERAHGSLRGADRRGGGRGGDDAARSRRCSCRPRVPKAEKARLLGAALEGAPREFVLFLQALVKRGRQRLLREIATEYQTLLDIKHNRVRAGVTLAPPGRSSAPARASRPR